MIIYTKRRVVKHHVVKSFRGYSDGSVLVNCDDHGSSVVLISPAPAIKLGDYVVFDGHDWRVIPEVDLVNEFDVEDEL